MRRKITMIPIAAALFASCSDVDPVLTEQTEQAVASQPAAEAGRKSGMTVLGDKIPNAYTPEVMAEAMAMLNAEAGHNKSAGVGTEGGDIAATHLYLKFAPRDSSDVALLDNDTTIMYTVIPMDREIVEIGDYYHDPSLPDSVPTFQYCVARIGQPLPDVPHETLSELFLMEEANVFDDESEDSTYLNKSARAGLWEELEDKALEIVGIADESTNKSKWRPQGEVFYLDNTLNKTVPMEGVPVRIHRGFVTHQCCTDKDGRFSFSRRRHHVRCYVKWRRDFFHLREIGHPFQQAESTLASHTKSSVSHTFTPGYDSWLYASVFRAAHQYYYNHAAYGLSRPGDHNLIIRLSTETPSELGDYGRSRILFLSDIHIYYKKLSDSRSFFMTTAHEIAHSAHHSWDRGRYRNCSGKMKESWARGVQWWMAKQYGYKIYSNTIRYTTKYTPVVMDLIDNDDREKTGPNKETYKENVSGILMSDIERALKSSTSWNSWRDNLIKLYPNQKEEITNVFKTWAN